MTSDECVVEELKKKDAELEMLRGALKTVAAITRPELVSMKADADAALVFHRGELLESFGSGKQLESALRAVGIHLYVTPEEENKEGD